VVAAIRTAAEAGVLARVDIVEREVSLGVSRDEDCSFGVESEVGQVGEVELF